MNTVLILTDTQPTRLVGAYGSEWTSTPNMDRLAGEGVRFDRAYTPCPLCTPARGAIFTGKVPGNNGAWANELTPGTAVPQMGTVLRGRGIRAGYTGKWHLDGAGYHGAGKADGGFEPDWWYDGSNYLDDVGTGRHRSFVHAITGGIGAGDGWTPEKAKQARQLNPAKALRDAGCTEELVWGHRVVDRAIDFLERVGTEPFVLVVSLDEPHGPFVTPPEFQEMFTDRNIPAPPNYRASLHGKPSLQKRQTEEYPLPDWKDFLEWRLSHVRCNAYVDHEIGRVMKAVERLHGDSTAVIATSDHGDQMGSHGLLSKGAMMYEESTRVPFIARVPGGPQGTVCRQPVSLIDLFPTILDLAGEPVPSTHHGTSLAPLLCSPQPPATEDRQVHIQFNRFGLYHQGYGAFYPIRCVTNHRYKLAINLLDDRDELYDLQEDPHEKNNRIDEPGLDEVRAELHEAILAEMHRTDDPFRGPHWGLRPWREVRPRAWFYGLEKES